MIILKHRPWLCSFKELIKLCKPCYIIFVKNKCKCVFIYVYIYAPIYIGFPCGLDSKESTCNAGDLGLIPGLGRYPGEGNGNPLQYSCLENSMDRGAWWATVHGLQRVGHDWATNTHVCMYEVWKALVDYLLPWQHFSLRC